MYEELIQRLRETSMDFGESDHVSVMLLEAANAIEELEYKYKKALGDLVKQTRPKWIPVTEWLPEKYTAVLAAGNGEVACGLFVGFAEPAHVASWDLDNVSAEPVTHWMPLPEPPKEE